MDARTAVGDAAVVQAVFDDTIALHQRMREVVQDSVIEAASAIRASLDAGGKLLVFGNGGSAADAQHLAAEMVGRFEREREGLPAIALTADASIVTSVANDFTFDWVFARQVEALGKREDVALGISTSGRSPNVLMALEAANAKGMKTIALTGRDGGVIGKAAGIHINVSHPSTARVQEVHRTVIHAICALVERAR
ncbi:MAG TPA: SIS domain-containing protein [Vicinamibacterales bacterium]|jgi:phosphoheptose isomerase|nr:SIS domain-containing protein [Vicinamibacterales bacterium]